VPSDLLEAKLLDESRDLRRSAEPHYTFTALVLDIQPKDVRGLLLRRLQLRRECLKEPLQVGIALASAPSVVNMLPEN
jgi:hypothetical protein